MWIQNLIILTLIAACLGYIARQSVQALAGRKSKLGSCCAKGCAAVGEEQTKQAAAKIQFMPVESLTRRRTP